MIGFVFLKNQLKATNVPIYYFLSTRLCNWALNMILVVPNIQYTTNGYLMVLLLYVSLLF
jgi:hypothetical protein